MEPLASVSVTASSQEDLARIANTLIAEGLAGCVNIIPAIRSIYVWDGAIEDDVEALALIHTRAELVGAVIDRVTELHPYEVPQALALQIDQAAPDYAAWLVAATNRPPVQAPAPPTAPPTADA